MAKQPTEKEVREFYKLLIVAGYSLNNFETIKHPLVKEEIKYYSKRLLERFDKVEKAALKNVAKNTQEINELNTTYEFVSSSYNHLDLWMEIIFDLKGEEVLDFYLMMNEVVAFLKDGQCADAGMSNQMAIIRNMIKRR